MALDIGHREFEREVRRARGEGRPTPRVAIVGGGLSGLATAIQLVRAGVRTFTDPRAVRRRRRHLARQRLPGCGLRRPLPPLLLLVRAQDRLVAPLRRTARDPRLRRGPGGPLRPGAPPPHRHHGDRGHVRRGHRHLAPRPRGRLRARDPRGRHRRLRLRAAQPAPRARGRGRRGFRRTLVALGPVGPLGRPRGQAGGRRRDGRERHPVRASGGGRSRLHHRVPAQPQLRRAEEGPSVRAGHPTGAAPNRTAPHRLPLVDLLDPRDCAGSRSAATAGRAASSRSCSARASGRTSSTSGCPSTPWSPTTPSGASGSSSPTTGTPHCCAPTSRWSTPPWPGSSPTPW